MSPQKDPYKELSIPHTATQEQIRRAYKKLCLRWHPDKHPEGSARTVAEARFKAVVLAYSILSDASSRAAYDAQHVTSDPFADPEYRRSFARRFAKQFAAEGHDVHADDLFESLFGRARDDFQDNFFADQRAPDKEVDLPLTLEEMYQGCVKKRRLRKPSGDTTPPTVLNIVIRPGYRPGDKIRFRDAAYTNNLPHDVVFTITQKAHEKFQLKQDDLHLTMRINLVDALAGAVLVVNTLDSTRLKVRIDTVIYPGYVHQVRGHGMPRRSAPDTRGDLFISFTIVFPTRVESEDRAAVRELFQRVDAHSRDRMSIRRSSSLFMSRQSAANILHGRRHSSTPQAAQNSESTEFADNDDSSVQNSGSQQRQRPDDPISEATKKPHAQKNRQKTIWKFPSIFR